MNVKCANTTPNTSPPCYTVECAVSRERTRLVSICVASVGVGVFVMKSFDHLAA